LSDYHARVQPDAANEQSIEAKRKQRFRRVVVFLLLAIVLLLLGLLLLAMATPEWQADGSRAPYGMATRAAICACLVGGTMLVPLSLRELILALLGRHAVGSALGVILGVLVGMTGLIAVPVELWLVMIVTDELEPGAQQRYEEDGDWDWDD
jgi:cell division protein FtsW (lipid II flippase)